MTGGRKTTKVCGVGINDLDSKTTEREPAYVNGKKVSKLVWCCPFYSVWHSMLNRCYSTKFHETNPTYSRCKVCDDWLYFSKFKTWMMTQEWEGRVLDKDLLVAGNKIYSPETCVFVDRKINNFLTERRSRRGKYLIGASWHKSVGNFTAAGRVNNKQVHLGCFDTELEAHKAWLFHKLTLAKELAAEQTDPRVAKALIERYENYKIN